MFEQVLSEFDEKFGKDFEIEYDPENYIHRGLNPAQHMSNAKQFLLSACKKAYEMGRREMYLNRPEVKEIVSDNRLNPEDAMEYLNGLEYFKPEDVKRFIER